MIDGGVQAEAGEVVRQAREMGMGTGGSEVMGGCAEMTPAPESGRKNKRRRLDRRKGVVARFGSHASVGMLERDALRVCGKPLRRWKRG